MADTTTSFSARREPRALRVLLIAFCVAFLSLFIITPLCTIFGEALRPGLASYLTVFQDRELSAAVGLTLLAAVIAVPLNTVAGVALALAIARRRFKGRRLLITVIELPFAVSPVIAGLLFVFLFGSFGLFGPLLARLHLKILFAVPGIVLATLFVTFPFVARELIPLLEELGADDEEAARSLGARGLSIFFRVTLPNIRWGLLYAVVLSSARAMGEFGAVAVVSGLIRGKTTTLPLYIEILYNEYHFSAAFAAASLLTLLSLVTLALKALLEKKRKEAA